MEVHIENKPAFRVLGGEGYGKSDQGPEWIRPLWDEAFNRLNEVKDGLSRGGRAVTNRINRAIHSFNM